MNKEYTIRDLYEIYCEAMPRYPLAYERFRDILHRDNSQIFTAESSETIIGFIVVNGNSVVILCVKKRVQTQRLRKTSAYNGRGIYFRKLR